MEYKANKQYNITYLDKQGNEKQKEYSPEQDTNIAGIINGFKNITDDFFKLKDITEVIEESKESKKSYYNKCMKCNHNSEDEFNELEDLNEEMKQKYTTDNNVKTWYKKEYPDDELGDEINPEVTFNDIYNQIGNIYKIINVNDSIVRERIFAKLSEIMNIDYDELYNKWLNEDEEDFEELEEVYLKEEENQEEVKENIDNAIEKVENTEKNTIAIESSNSSIDILLASEQSAIDTYNSFLNQSKEILIPTLYEVLEKEIQEIIKDEEEHITKLNTIKEAFHINK